MINMRVGFLAAGVLVAQGKITDQVLPSRGSAGTPPGLPDNADLTADIVYSSLCDHFVGTLPANNIQCANRCRAMFARRNDMETSLAREANKLGISAKEHAHNLVMERRKKSTKKSTKKTRKVERTPVASVLNEYPLMNVTNNDFDSIIQRLAPDCAFQSYLLDSHGSPKYLDFCFSRYVVDKPEHLIDVAKKIEGAVITKATSPANCQYQCQLNEECYLWNFDTQDESTCVQWPLSYAQTFSRPVNTFVGKHPCKKDTGDDGLRKIGTAPQCMKCEGHTTGAYDSQRFITGSKYCTTERQTLCEVEPHAAPSNPFASLKMRIKDSRKRTLRKYRWRHKGETEWHSSDELIDHEGE